MSTQIESIRPIYFLPTDCVGGECDERAQNNPIEKTPEQQVIEAFTNREATTFVKENLLNKAKIFFPNHVLEAEDMVESVFALMILQSRMSRYKTNVHLQEIFRTIHQQIISGNDWFPQAYNSYRIERAEKDFKLIFPYLKGSEILDFGCGMGHLDAVLNQNGFVVTQADVIDYENKVTREDEKIKFKKMSSPTDIEYPDKRFDTIIIWQVLHHIDEKDLFPILSGLSKIGGRLIINEEIYGNGDGVKGFSQSISEQKELSRYMALEEKVQLQILGIIDHISNSMFRLSEHEMNIPLRYKPVDQWNAVISKAGFDIEGTYSIGIKEYKWHPDPQILIVADSKKNTS